MNEKRKFKLSERLSACAALVRDGAVVADIGTDHAMLPVHLVKIGKCERAIASDIAKKPYESAASLVKEYDLTDKIDVRLGGGLEKISPDEITDIVIAGMGGELIAQILEDAEWVRNKKYNLILQPMSKASVLRSWLLTNGFSIESETAVTDSDRDYTIINSLYTGEKQIFTELESYCGKLIPCKNDSARRLLRKQAAMLRNEVIGLKHSGEAERAQEITEIAEALEGFAEE